MNVFKDFPKVIERTLYHTSGSEGPRHDPYHYDEYVVETAYEDGEVERIKIHLGLGVWVKIGRSEDQIRGEYGEISEIVYLYVGVDLDQIEKIIRQEESPKKRCPHCGSKQFNWGHGYAGEGLQGCARCGRMLWEQPVTLSMIE